MPAKKFSLMIVDKDREVRESLGEIFRDSGYDVRTAEDTGSALHFWPEDVAEASPDAIILGQMRQNGVPENFLSELRNRRPQSAAKVSLIVFPSFRVSVSGRASDDARQVPACRVSTVSNLMALVRGLAQKQLAALAAQEQ